MCADRETDGYKMLFQTLQDFKIAEGGQFCDPASELEGLLEKLNCLGYSYSVRRPSDATKNKTGLFFQHLSGSVPLTFMGSAFRIEGISHRQCVFGPKYYRKKETAAADHLVTLMTCIQYMKGSFYISPFLCLRKLQATTCNK